MELVEKLSNRQYIDGEWQKVQIKIQEILLILITKKLSLRLQKVLLKMQKEQYLQRRRAFEDAEWSLETSEVRGKK